MTWIAMGLFYRFYYVYVVLTVLSFDSVVFSHTASP